MNSEEVGKFKDELRKVEGELEALGRSICSVEGGASSWHSINDALENVRDAIHNAFCMNSETRKNFSNLIHNKQQKGCGSMKFGATLSFLLDKMFSNLADEKNFDQNAVKFMMDIKG